MHRPALVFALLFGTVARADVPHVVTDIPAVHSLALQVMGDLGGVDVLLTQGADPHSFQLNPAQARSIAQADLIFWIGPELTPWLDRALAGIGTKGTALSLLHAPGVKELSYDDTEYEEASEDHAHLHDGIDPHAWLDPENARVWISLIADQLAEKDPEHAATYRGNARLAAERIDRLTSEVSTILANAHQAPIIVFHDAYDYFAQRFDLTIAGSIRVGDATAPSAAELVALRNTMRSEQVACVFTEAQHDPALAQTVIEGTDIHIAALDPSGSMQPFGPDLYTDMIRSLATAIADCISGKG